MQITRINCPHPGCNYVMYPDDVLARATTRQKECFRALIKVGGIGCGSQRPVYPRLRVASAYHGTLVSQRDFTRKAVTLFKDSEVKQWVEQFCRACPACHMIIEREFRWGGGDSAAGPCAAFVLCLRGLRPHLSGTGRLVR